MKTKVSPTLVGLFVLGACGLGLIALLSFGGVTFFSKPQRFVVYFDESINGLDLGSPVKLRGVHVGRVVDLVVRYDEEQKRSVVQVTCELSRNKITDSKGEMIDVSNRADLDGLIGQGLHAQLGILGLATGLLYVELSFQDSDLEVPPPADQESAYTAVPSSPSAISEFQSNFTEILRRIREIDFAGLARESQRLLAEANRQLARSDLPGLAQQWQRTGASIDSLARSPEVESMISRLNEASLRVSETLAVVERQVGTTGGEVRDTLQNVQRTLDTFNATAADVQRFVQAQSGLGDDVASALRQLTDALASVQQLAEYLQRNPNALIYGRRPENN